jgi:hypothetical protein
MVLAHDLKNERLSAWAEKELNGYGPDDDFPEYRKTAAPAKGLFLGPGGMQSDNQPIPPGALREDLRHFAESVKLHQPIAAYEGAGKKSSMRFDWPANLTVMYQKAFFEGHFALNRAWQEVPGSVFVGLLDTIKTRVLRFALELKSDLGEVHDHISELPKGKVDQSVVNNIYGGNVVIGSTNVTQIGSVEIRVGDWAGLSRGLEKLGVPTASISELQAELAQDSKDSTKPGLGKRAAAWLAKIGKDSGQALLSVGVEVAKKEATKYISQYLGLPT